MQRIRISVLVLCILSSQLFSGPKLNCNQTSLLNKNEIIVGITYRNKRIGNSIKVPVFGALIVIENNSFKKIEGNVLSTGLEFYFPLISDKNTEKIVNGILFKRIDCIFLSESVQISTEAHCSIPRTVPQSYKGKHMETFIHKGESHARD